VSDEGDIARDLNARDILLGLAELKDTLARLERLLVRIALGMGIKPDG
jgi:hypothetical protein